MKKLIIFLLSILIIGLTFIIYGCSQAPKEKIGISQIETEPVGKEVSTGLIRWQVKEAEDLGIRLYSDAGGYLDSEEGKFAKITFSVENNSDDARVIYDLTVIDDKGRKHNI